MRHDYDYLIIGAGMVADSAAKGIRELDAEGTIGIVGAETTPPFYRPSLSKDLWTDPDATEQANALDTASGTGAELHLGLRAARLDRDAKVVHTEDGDEFGYQQLLLATGGRPRELDALPAAERVVYFRTLRDYQRLRQLTGAGTTVAVVGGGYIGSEMAAALTQAGSSVTMIFPEPGPQHRMFPEQIRHQVEKTYRDSGVTLRAGTTVRTGSSDDTGVHLELDDGSALDADVAVVGLGIVPNGELAAESGLETADDGSVVVDLHLATLDPAVHAAGDVATYADRILGRRRVEHVDNAEKMGAAAGRIMAGSDEAYEHTPIFWSDLFDLGYEAIGVLDSSLETVVVDKGEGNAVVYYLDDRAVVGVLLWGVWDSIDKARELLKQRPTQFDDLI